MNSLEEIKSQNKFDCFVRMYGYIAQAILDAGGSRGERAVREAVIRYGNELGENLQKVHVESGRKTNLHTLLADGTCCGEDPRFYRNTVKDTEQVQLYEVFCCPMETIWRKDGCTQAGRLYCEEYVHSLLKTYTNGKGQANVSNMMTCERDSFCRFAMYLRPANMDEEQREMCFGGELLNQTKQNMEYQIEEHFLLLYGHLAAAAEEFLGLDGTAALAKGLDRLAESTATALVSEAERTGESLDGHFVKNYFPLELEGRMEYPQGFELKSDAWQMLQSHLLGRLRKKLCL